MSKRWPLKIIGGLRSAGIYVKSQTYVGSENEKSRRVLTLRDLLTEDQLLDLHTNLTCVQSRLLEILHEQLGEAEARESREKNVRKVWTEFTSSLEDALESISANTTTLMRELFIGLLKLQSFTKESAKYVGEELQWLQDDVHNVREHLRRLHEDIQGIGTEGISKVDKLSEHAQDHLSKVFGCFFDLMRYNICLMR